MLSQSGMYGKHKSASHDTLKGRGVKFDLVFTYGYVQFSESDKQAIESMTDLAEELRKYEKQEASKLQEFSLGSTFIDSLRNKQAALPNLKTLCAMRENDVNASVKILQKKLEEQAAFDSWDQHLGRNKLATQFFLKIEMRNAKDGSHVFSDFDSFRQFIEDGCQAKLPASKRAKR